MNNIKHLILPHATNIRDLGGLQTQNGKAIRWNKLFRADALSTLDETEWRILYQKGIRTVVDLRSFQETEMFPDTVPKGISWVHCPLQEENLNIYDLDEGAAAAFRRSMAECYTDIAAKTPQLLCTALGEVVKGLKTGAVIFHCTAGKDRTGVLAATLLYLLGAYECDIIADYEVSNTYNRNGLHKMLEDLPNYDELLPMLNSNPENIRALLIYYNQTDILSLLAENGFGAENMQALQAAVLE